MELKSLKQSDQEWNGASAPADEHYPSLYIEGKSLDALSVGNPKIGTEMTMVSTVRVSSISARADGSRSMALEVLEASVQPKEPPIDRAAILFPNG